MKTTTDQMPTFTPKQLHTELDRCEYCEEKPCREACPAHCSPADFIMAARIGFDSDFRRAAAEIMSANPLGGVCGMVCPDNLCMAACTRMKFDGSINIPKVQATIIAKAKEVGGIPEFRISRSNGLKVAVVGGGPAGLGATSALVQMGYEVTLYEMNQNLGGMMNFIPKHRLESDVVNTDIQFLLSLGRVSVRTNTKIEDPKELLLEGYHAVCVAAGLWHPIRLGIPNENLAIRMVDLLANPEVYKFTGRVAIIGGGATAVDCAITAKKRGAENVELFMLEKNAEMPITARERNELLEYDIEISGRTRVSAIREHENRIVGIETVKVELPREKTFSPAHIVDLPDSICTREGFSEVVVAIGMRSEVKREIADGIYYAGDLVTGPRTVVQAVASGKNAALLIDAYVGKKTTPAIKEPTKSYHILPGYTPKPISLETEFFGRKIISPYLISASPSTDGLDQMIKAYEAGWAGGIMKTAFDNVPIHIPGEYMYTFNNATYANCDNVSGHSLDRVCREIDYLVNTWPDRLTMASTGGPVTGQEDCDAAGWQANTKKIESAGVMGIEYSLSCPQGGDGTEGAIVSQNAQETAKIIDWIMEIGDPEIPKLFKLTAAVTSIVPILRAIRKVLARYPEKKAGITLANSFPTLAFRSAVESKWEKGVIVGMSGEGVTPISYLSLAQAVPEGIEISGNGGPMNYKAAMDFLALGVKTVQFCTVVMKQGYGIINELESGTSFQMQARGIRSIEELIGITQPHPIIDFMDLSAIKKISQVQESLCVSCGNCARCPYLAITLDEQGIPVTDAARCIGCTICAKKCFTGAIIMRDRTSKESSILVED